MCVCVFSYFGLLLCFRQEPSEPNWIGMVCQKTSPAAVAEAAIEDAKFVCTRQYGDAPDVTLHGRLDLTFSCEIPSCISEMWRT